MLRKLKLWFYEFDVVACYRHYRRDLKWSRTRSTFRAFWCAWC